MRLQVRYNFYPRPPRGGRLEAYIKPLGLRLFLSTPSARRSTRVGRAVVAVEVISIHALREEGDVSVYHVGDVTRVISIHALREEGDPTGVPVSVGRG